MIISIVLYEGKLGPDSSLFGILPSPETTLKSDPPDAWI